MTKNKDKEVIHGIISFRQNSKGDIKFTTKCTKEAKRIGLLIKLCHNFLSDPEMMSKMITKAGPKEYIEFIHFEPTIFRDLKIDVEKLEEIKCIEEAKAVDENEYAKLAQFKPATSKDLKLDWETKGK